jgi:IS30 family transposase
MHTVASDNGKEFAKNESIAKNLDAKFFFAHPYTSWERGFNENTNGLIRQYSRKNSIKPYLGSASPVGDGKTQ